MSARFVKETIKPLLLLTQRDVLSVASIDNWQREGAVALLDISQGRSGTARALGGNVAKVVREGGQYVAWVIFRSVTTDRKV
jgi:hypothetical protein